jgi:hypothetical protein
LAFGDACRRYDLTQDNLSEPGRRSVQLTVFGETERD